MTRLIAQGAEAKLYRSKAGITKDRFAKAYRLPQLDERLRKSRTKREAKVLGKLAEMDFPAPRLVETDDRQTIVMQDLDGSLLKDVLSSRNLSSWCRKFGEGLAELHNNQIIHGDLTTSNLIAKGKALYFLDFGLSFFSFKAEDKAVDLHGLKEALASKHHDICEKCFKVVLEAYKGGAKDSKAILERLEKVERRGRYRAKRGN